MRTNMYLQNAHTAIVDGIPWTGFADGDFIEWEIKGNAAEITTGGDGPAMNISVFQGATVTINLLPTSPALGIALQIWNKQRIQPRMFTIAIMTGVKEIITASGCAFAELPKASTGGPTMQPRSFVIKCLGFAVDTAGVETVVGGFVGGTI